MLILIYVDYVGCTAHFFRILYKGVLSINLPVVAVLDIHIGIA